MLILTMGVLLPPALHSRAAQQDNGSRWGISGNLRWLDPRSTIAAFPAIPTCCSLLDAQEGWGFGASVVRELIPSGRFGLEGSLGVASSTINLASGSFVGWALEGTGSVARVVRAESLTEVGLRATSLETGITGTWLPWTTAPDIRLYCTYRSNWNLSASLRQSERLITPASAVFSDTRERTRLNFDVPVNDRINPLHMLVVGAGVETPMSSAIDLSVRLGLEVALNGMLNEGPGAIHAGRLRLDLVAFFSPEQTPVAPDTLLEVPPTPPIVTEPHCLVRLDSAVSQEFHFVRRRIFSLLPYVFFAKGSADLIGQRYVALDFQTSRSFQVSSVISSSADSLSDIINTLKLYHNVLNIVGQRMRDQYPQAVLRIAGYTDDADQEFNNRTLARRRAMAVADYLHTVWRIDTARLVISAGRLSPTAALTTMPIEQDRLDGREENRRIELQSSVAEVLDPVVVYDTTMESSSLRVWGFAETNTAQADYRLSMLIGDGTHLHLCATDTLGAAGRRVLSTDLDSMCGSTPHKHKPVTVSAILESPNVRSQTCSDSCVISIRRTFTYAQRDASGVEVDRFRLTQFQYDAGQPLEAQQSLIERYVLPSVKPSSSIELLGFTDRKGPEDANQRLSQQRIDMLARILRDRATVTPKAFGEGSGDAPAPFPNDTPEGRLYNRTVEVIVRTPSGAR